MSNSSETTVPTPTITGTCHSDTCSESLSPEQPAITINQTHALCSPDCAYDFLDTINLTFKNVTLHDPQFEVDRKPLPVHEDTVAISRPVNSRSDAKEAVETIDSFMSVTFHPE